MSCIVIPTYKRADRLMSTDGTLRYISDYWKSRTFLLVREEEKKAYKKVCDYFNVGILVMPRTVTEKDPLFDWSQTMDYILDVLKGSKSTVVTMDDDLKLSYRNDMSVGVPTKQTASQFNMMMEDLTNRSYDFPIAGIITRGFSLKFQKEVVRNRSVAGLFAMDVPFFTENPQFRFFNDTCRFMGDRFMCLNTLTKGVQNEVFCRYCYDGVANTEGGCSTHRTNKNHNDSALGVARLFPGIVDLRIKTNLGDTRVDLHIDWKKAYTGD